tara:strand:- start:13997 stop:14596 length:600 start_codon:yes stop_codon:yes gene_type:complete
MINYKEEIEKDQDLLKNVRTDLQHWPLSVLQEMARDKRKNYSVCLLNLTGNLNIGTCIRTASIFNARRVITIGRKKYDKRSTVGAENYIEVISRFGLTKDYEIDTQIFWDTMTEFNMTPVFIEQGGIPLDTFIWKSTYLFHYCLVFGNEGRGIPDKLIEEAETNSPHSFVLSIDQPGILRSLNVSSAAAIVMHDIERNI